MALGTFAGVPPTAGAQSVAAASPVHVGGLLRPSAELGGSAEGGEVESPTSVALSSNGAVALVGAPEANGGVGSVSVFTRSGSSWIQQGPALAAGGELGEGEFGWSVALSASGDVALIAGRSNGAHPRGKCCAAGAVWVFTRAGSTWAQQAELSAGRADENGEFGSSVALSSDGRTAVIGAPRFGHPGAAWIFTDTRSGWRRGAELEGSGASADAFFGSSVALSSDGGTALVGGNGDAGGGAAWVFSRRQSKWISQGPPLKGKETTEFARFGTAVALSSTGSTALVGAGGEDGEQGAAWIFTRSGSTWRRRKKLTGRGETPLGNFGESVALSSNGEIALIGCPMDNGSGLERVGAAWLFSGTGSSWTQRAEIAAPATGGEDGLFGLRLALSGAGTTALFGVEVDDGDPGTAWVLAD